MPLVRHKYLNDTQFNVKLKIFYNGHTTPKNKTIVINARNSDHAWVKAKEIVNEWENVKSFRMLFIEDTRTGQIIY